ncbi:hypothetical protein T484DRAFT_1929114 [Baffinella frigidus]|nr:hypothetical protein T484DRAFT_1929114 [Cryptophyta sp. CCMP2293]
MVYGLWVLWFMGVMIYGCYGLWVLWLMVDGVWLMSAIVQGLRGVVFASCRRLTHGACWV